MSSPFQVQCSNIHFHAHPDGRTTIHNHRTCRKNSSGSGSVNTANGLSNFSQEVEKERYMGVRILSPYLSNSFHSSPLKRDRMFAGGIVSDNIKAEFLNRKRNLSVRTKEGIAGKYDVMDF